MSKRAEYRRAIKELKVMILLGEGRWLNEKPISCGNKKFIVDGSVLNNLIREHPELNKHILIGFFSSPQRYPLLRYKDRQLTLSL